VVQGIAHVGAYHTRSQAVARIADHGGLVARRSNNRKVVGSMPASVMCITVDR